MKRNNLLYAIMATMTVVACSDQGIDVTDPTDVSNVINVGGVNASDIIDAEVVTRAGTKAEDIAWLAPALKNGIDVTYYLASKPADTRTAILKLEEEKVNGSDSTYYSFNYKGTTTPAVWLGNGGHMFHGFHIPEELTSPESETALADQSDSTNYTNLIHYLCMPPNQQIQATVSYVRLPFRHRLSRVITYVLIDPLLDAEINNIAFDNVKILSSVSGTTPKWTTARKTTPHNLGKRGSMSSQMEQLNENFLAYYDTEADETYYPTSKKWAAAKAAYEAGSSIYEETNYGKVPCYDIIIRPTYTDSALVMYDEEDGTADESNSIDFVVDLDNGLSYEKTVNIDLDSNYQTVIYLHIAREKVDYQTMGSEEWQVQTSNDDPYGLDNENEHRLSKAGGSWQRAYRIGTNTTTVTDGSEYTQQYISQSDWLSKFTKAVVDGDNWGDYFVLTEDLEINVADLPANFVFAGHLDARGHTITLVSAGGSRTYLFDGLNGTYDAEEGVANCHTERGILVPLSGYRAEVLNVVVSGGTLFKEMSDEEKAENITGYVYNCK